MFGSVASSLRRWQHDAENHYSAAPPQSSLGYDARRVFFMFNQGALTTGSAAAQLALEDMTQIGLLSAVPGAPTVVGSLVAWNFVTMTMMPAYLIASMVEANVDLGRVLGKSTGDAMPAPNGDIGEV